MPEAISKSRWPGDCKRIIHITRHFSSGWRRVHVPVTGHDAADDPTTAQFAIAMLAARIWNGQDFAGHPHVSMATVKRHLSSAMGKLSVARRDDRQKEMLE